jgi:hypothetical protein
MQDSTLTLPGRQETFFITDFHYTGWMERDSSSLLSFTPLPQTGSFLFPSPIGEGFNPMIRTVHSSDWIFMVILTGFLLLTITRFYYEKRLGLLTSAVFSRTSANLLIRESHVMRHQSFIYLIIIYLISITLLLYQSFRYFDPGAAASWQDALLYLEITGAFIAFFIIKITLIRLTGFIFKNPDTASEYIQNIFIFNLFGGIILLPLLLMIGFGSARAFLYAAFGIMALLMILRFIRGFFIGLSDHKFSLFHLFLYLCTLEILPVLIIAKFADKYFFS